MGIFGQVLGAVAGPLINGIFGSRKQEAKAQGVDYQKLVRDATAAGFNPMTALMAGGGQGYQREFNPALSSGSFIAEAVTRGADTYFNAVADRDAQADQLRREAEDRQRWETEIGLKYGQRHGYSLRDVAPYAPTGARNMGRALTRPVPLDEAVSVGGPALNRPMRNPLDRPPEYIPVRMPNGNPGKLDRSIAEQLSIKPWNTVPAGTNAEIIGEVPGEALNVYDMDAIRDTAYGEPYIGAAGSATAPTGKRYSRPPLAPRGSKTDAVYDRIFKGKIKPPSGRKGQYYNGR